MSNAVQAFDRAYVHRVIAVAPVRGRAQGSRAPAFEEADRRR
jgi:hypothetical protein